MLRFQSKPDTQVSLPPPGKMTEAEAQAVVALWAKQKDAPLLASVVDVADALDTTPAEAARLLAQVRAENVQKEQAARQRKTSRLFLSAIGLIVIGWLSTVDFAPGSPTLTVEGSRTSSMTAQQKPMFSGMDDTRTEVNLAYHPHTLLRSVLGPQWAPPTQETFITDGSGKSYLHFAFVPGGGGEGIGQGYFARTGLLTYSRSYFYPATKLPAGPLMLHADLPCDGQDTPIEAFLR